MKFEQTLQQLIAQPSVSSADPNLDNSNLPIIHLLADQLESLGFGVVIQKLENDKANLIATLGTGNKGLVLAGHTDTVPFDEARWQSDPLVLTEKDGRFHGLGVTDMKSFFAVALEAIKSFEASDFRQPLILLATADEESSMAGARALSHNELNARYAVVGEPTSLKPIRLHKGVMMESVRLLGQSGHSSNPALGKSALDAMHHVITELIELRDSWAKTYQNPAFHVDIPTMNLASIHGGDAPNRICSHCELRFDVRLMPGMRSNEVREIIRRKIDKALEDSGITASVESIFDGVEPFEQAANSELIQTVEALTGQQSESAGFATEAPFLQALGMETVVLGPGTIDCAHQANEYLDQTQIKPAIELLKSLIQRYCLS